MPNIETFTAQGSASPNDKGIQAAEVAGRRIGAYGHQLEGDANQIASVLDQHQTNMEVSHGSAIGATAYSGFTTSLNQVVRNADPNDQSAVPKWQQEVFQPWADNFVSNFKTKGGQLWARNYTDAMRQHFTEAAISDQSTMAGIAAHQNRQTAVLGYTSTAYQDPSSLTNILAANDADLETYKANNPNLTGRDLAQIEDSRVADRAGIAEAAVRGMIQHGDIKGARDFLQSPEAGQLLDGKTQIPQLVERADQQEELNQNRAEHLQNAAQKQQVVALKTAATQLETGISDYEAVGQPDPGKLKAMIDQRDQLVNSPLAGEAEGEIGRVNELLVQVQRPDFADAHVRTNPTVSADLLGRLTIDADQPGAITEPELLKDYKDGTLSKADYSTFHEALPRVGGDPVLKGDLSRLKSWQEQFRGQIAAVGAQSGGIAFDQFVHDSSLQFMQWYKADPQHAFDIITNGANPRSFVGSGAIQRYVDAAGSSDPMKLLATGPGAQRLMGVTPAPAAAAIAKAHANPIQPGESWSAYKARVGL